MFSQKIYILPNILSNITKSFMHCSAPTLWKLNTTTAELDLNYLCNSANAQEIAKNINLRKGVGNIELVNRLKSKLDSTHWLHQSYGEIESEFYNEALKIPNKTHPSVLNLKDKPSVIKHIGSKKQHFAVEPKDFHTIVKRLNLIRTDQLGNFVGNRGYYLLGEMVELEQALIKYTVNSLLKNNFELVSVPDIFHRSVVEACGLNTRGARTQVYTLDPLMYGVDLCLSGTSEIALAGYFKNKVINEKELPLKVAAVSRCYRAEISNTTEERGIYRVHQFTKVEMFALSAPEQSDDILEEFINIQEQNFEALGLYCQILDMPPNELGAAAYRKYDVEAWMPGRKMYGEVSSCSNCTDYQSRRLNIKYKNCNGETKFVHTLNGTACAIPRMLIAVTETYQTDKVIEIPHVLQKYMRNKSSVSRQKKVPELKLIKNKAKYVI